MKQVYGKSVSETNLCNNGGYWLNPFVNGTGAVCEQKASKFFVSSREKSIAGHMGINGVYY
jgi:hypothetical protein